MLLIWMSILSSGLLKCCLAGREWEFFQGLKQPAYGTGLCFIVCSQARRLLLNPGDPGLLVMLLLITAARCLSED